jgi:hypothetical protein
VEPRLNVTVTNAFRRIRFVLPVWMVQSIFEIAPLHREALMSNAKEKTPLKTYHATMEVTRVEEWCVDAETPEQAEALLAAGQGHRCNIGECLRIEVGKLEPTA